MLRVESEKQAKYIVSLLGRTSIIDQDENGIYIQLCCDEFDYLQCCISKKPRCESCNDKKCKRSQKSTNKTGFSF